LLRVYLEPIWPKVVPNSIHDYGEVVGTKLGGHGNLDGIGTVILVVDTKKLATSHLTTIADYAAMLTLSFIQSPDHCDPLPSILDAMSPSCGNRPKPTAITAGDLAFLKALYNRNFVYGDAPSRGSMAFSMMQQFKGLPP
jgi:hypothetical protein